MKEFSPYLVKKELLIKKINQLNEERNRLLPKNVKKELEKLEREAVKRSAADAFPTFFETWQRIFSFHTHEKPRKL